MDLKDDSHMKSMGNPLHDTSFASGLPHTPAPKKLRSRSKRRSTVSKVSDYTADIQSRTGIEATYTTFASFSFWISDTPYDFFHKIDSIMARIAIVSVIFYKVFVYRKNLFWFLCLTSITLFLFHISSISSNEKWGSDTHVRYHILSHLFAILTIIVGLHSSL
jgi:hypothetical protein